MRLLQGSELKQFVTTYVHNALPSGETELDIRVGTDIYIEKEPHRTQNIHRLHQQTWRDLYDCRRIRDQGEMLKHGQFVLTTTLETFNLPTHIKGILNLRSWAAKSGVGQTASLGLKPSWTGSLILELTNSLKNHNLHLFTGDVIGQIEFYDISGER